MSLSSRISTHAWILVLLAALAFSGWADARRLRRIEQVSLSTEPVPARDDSSLTGYAGGVRHLLVPEQNLGSYQWIAQTQQMLAQHEWRVRHVSYDNTPYGREVRSASLYRWWLGALAWIDHRATGRPIGASVEHAARYSDPALHALFLIGIAWFAALQFGGWTAAAVVLALAAGFPLAAAYLPGQPDDQGMVLGGVLWTLLFLLTGLRRAGGDGRWFALAGVAAGVTLWADVTVGVPLVLGIMLGAACEAWVGRGSRVQASAHPWSTWTFVGAATVLLGYLIDYYPGLPGPAGLEALHPLYGLAWLGAGEWLEWGTRRMRGVPAAGGRSGRWRLILAAVAVALVPAVLAWRHSPGFLVSHLLSWRLSGLPDSPIAESTLDWVARMGAAPAFVAALLPLALVVPAGWRLLRGGGADERRPAMAFALGPVLVAVAYALGQLRWWATLDATLVGLLVAMTAGGGRPGARLARAAGTMAALAVLAVELVQLYPRAGARVEDGVSLGEVEGLVERDLAHWLATRTGSAHPAVLAPPNFAAALAYYGGARALSTPYRENADGFAAAVRIAGTTLPDEAYALVRRRGLTHIIVPSWDNTLDEYARLGAGQPDKSFVSLLHRWTPPRWLRPIPYQVPAIPGFEGRTIAVFEVVDLQDEATGLGCLAEYFVEMGDLDRAAEVADALGRWFPEDVGALVARAVVERARGNAPGFDRCLAALDQSLATGAEELGWERRVLLALVFAEARRFEAARTQLQRCCDEADEARLRALTPGTLYRMQALGRVLGIEISNSRLRTLALTLLPAESRDRLQAIPAGPAR